MLLGLAVLVFAPLLVPGRAPYSPFTDIVAEHLALKQLGFESWTAHGKLPLWRDDQWSGAPALTNPQALYLHPLHVLFWFLQPVAAFGPTLVLQFLVFACGCSLLARRLGASHAASLFCGAAGLCAFKPMLSAYAGWLPPLATLALVPWLLAGLIALADRADRTRGALLALVGAVAFAGGSPQLLYYAGLLMAPYFLIAAGGTRARLRALIWLTAALGLGLVCNAYLWGSVASEWPWLARSEQSHDLAFFFSGHPLSAASLLTLLQPHAFGQAASEPWEQSAYFGLLPLGLALIAGFGAQRRTAVRYCFLALIASLLLSLDTSLLKWVHAYVPGYASFRLPGRMLFLSTCLGVALAGPGLDRVLAPVRERPRAYWILIAAALTITAPEGANYARTYLSTAPYAQLLPALDHPARRIAGLPERGARAAVAGRTALNYGWSAALGLRLINGYEPYHYAHYKRFMTLCDTGEARNPSSNWVDIQHLRRPDLLDEISARHVIAETLIPLPQLELIARAASVRNFVLYAGLIDKPLFVYENRSARPYARLARLVRRVPSLEHMAERMQRTRLSGQAYVLDSAPAWLPEAPGPDATERVELDQVGAGHALVRTQASAPRVLVLSETFHPGWSARIDGRAATPLQVNLALLGVALPSGAHRVELTFAPLDWTRNVTLSLLALTLLLGWLTYEAVAAAKSRSLSG